MNALVKTQTIALNGLTALPVSIEVNTYNGDTALFMSYAGIYEVDQSFGNTGFCHNVSGQNKERDSKKQEFTDSGVHICSYDRQRCTGIKDGTYR